MISSVRDIPASVLRPQQWDKWEIKAYCGKSGDIHIGTTFVRAANEERAKELGKSALRLLGVRGRFVLNARQYFPWYVPAMAGFMGFVS